MESPGEHLKRERELRGHTLKKVFEVTRVPLRYLEALEADDFDSLPQPAYVKGFLRAYCKFLGIDDNDSVLRYDLYLREKPGKSYELTPLPNVADKRSHAFPALHMKWFIPGLVGIGLITVIIIYAVTRRVELPQNTVRQEQPLVAEAPKTEVAPEALPEKPMPQAKAPLTLQPVKPVVPVPQAGAQARLKEPQPSGVSQVVAPQRPAIAPEKRDEVIAGKQLTERSAAKTGHSLYVKATEDSWIKLRIDDATEPIDVLLRAGEAVSWKADNTFSIILGNAGGVALSLDGAPLGILGKSGEVVSLVIPRDGSGRTTQTGAVTATKPVPAQSVPAGTQKE